MVKCPYCDEAAREVTGAAIYPGRRDLHSKRFYLCRPCEAWVGCHPGTNKPLGRLADADLRKAKQAAHAQFDLLWKTSLMSRTEAYRWLASKMFMTKEECHIGKMDEEQCAFVAEASNEKHLELVRRRHKGGQRATA